MLWVYVKYMGIYAICAMGTCEVLSKCFFPQSQDKFQGNELEKKWFIKVIEAELNINIWS